MLAAIFRNPRIHDAVDPLVAVLWQNAHRDGAERGDVTLVPEIFHEAPRRERIAVDVFQRLVDVGQGQREADGLAIFVLDEVDEVRVGERLEAFGHEVELLVGHGHEAPVLLPRLVVNVANLLDLAVEVFHVHVAYGQPLFFQHVLGDFAQTADIDHLLVDVPCKQLLADPVTAVQAQVVVIRRVIEHEEHRRAVVALRQHAALVVHRGTHRPAHRVEALALEPHGGGLEKRVGNLLVVHALEKSPETYLVVVNLVVTTVLDRGDGARHGAILPGGEHRQIGMFVERIALGVERLHVVRNHRRHPVHVQFRIFSVDFPGEPDELFALMAGLDPPDFDAHD